MSLRKKIISAFLSVCMIYSFASAALSVRAEEGIAIGFSEYSTAESLNDDHVGEIVEDLYQAKEALKTGLESLDRRIDVRGMGLYKENVEDFYYTFIFSNPQFFYIYSSFSYSYDTSNNSILYIAPKYITAAEGSGSETEQDIAQQNTAINEMKVNFDKKTAELMSCIDDSMSDVEKLLALHDVLACHMTYSKESSGEYKNSVYTAYGSIVEGRGVCQAYTLGYEYLAKLAGINDIYLVSNKYHSWNMVQLDGNWYHIDVTFDDPVSDIPGRVYHKYFMISDSKLLQNDKSENHATWSPSYSAADSTYDSGDYFWLNTESQIIYENGKVYYVDMSNQNGAGYSTGAITEMNSDGSKNVIAKVEDYWSSGTGFYLKNYTRIFKEGDYIYYNGPSSVMRVNVNDGSSETIYTLDDTIDKTNHIYSLQKGDGIIYIGYSKTPGGDLTVIPYEYSFGGTSEEPAPEYELGDVNKDNVINIADVTALQSFIAGSKVNIDVSLADVDKNGDVTIQDCTAIQKIIAGA